MPIKGIRHIMSCPFSTGGYMGSVSASGVSQSVDAVNQILMMASKESLEMAEKLMKVTVQAAVGKDAGKGGGVDVTG
jgi:hypothetical protein